MPSPYRQLSQVERDRLSIFKAEGKSIREIARLLNRNPSTISRELKRNAPPIRSGRYLPHKAQCRADARKANAHRRIRLRDPHLRAYVRRQLKRGWSPERIAGRWRRLGHSISHEAIYQWIYAKARDFRKFLPRFHRRRLPRGHRRKSNGLCIPSRTPLSDRPQVVDSRRQAGHWEADLILGSHSLSAIQILIERRTRFTRLSKLRGKGAAEMRRALNRALSRYPKHMRRTITYDNGKENVQHEQVNRKLGTRSYFCAPMQSWQKGSVENAAGLVRRHLPKKTDLSIVPPAQVKWTERWLNGLPRKCLSYKTAAEAFRQSVALTS